MLGSRPARARGLKPKNPEDFVLTPDVAPRAGAWIETHSIWYLLLTEYVAPRAGAWIETVEYGEIVDKYYVAPRAGAWIETKGNRWMMDNDIGRAPRGRVD